MIDTPPSPKSCSVIAPEDEGQLLTSHGNEKQQGRRGGPGAGGVGTASQGLPETAGFPRFRSGLSRFQHGSPLRVAKEGYPDCTLHKGPRLRGAICTEGILCVFTFSIFVVQPCWPPKMDCWHADDEKMTGLWQLSSFVLQNLCVASVV